MLEEDRAREACGVVGVYAPGEDVARIAYFGLFALQHRGQESAGIATTDGSRLSMHASMGLVAQVFDEATLRRLTGRMAIGHTRYSTMGASRRRNAQPIVVSGAIGQLAVGHNGNVINAGELRAELESWGCSFTASSDSEVIAHLYANAPGITWEERSAHCMRKLRGAYTLVMLTRDAVVGVRDPLGVRPLCLGRLNGGGHVLASETCALKHLGATFEREIDPGETVVIDDTGVHSTVWSGARSHHSMCIFEHIYFARPDSVLAGRLAYTTRMAMGAQLAREYPVEADLVIGVPDSATAAATGYSRESGIPFGEGLVKNRYVGRTFIEPDQRLRDIGVQMKFNTLPELIGGRRLVVVDDSIVRGTTTPPVLRLLREAGAREIHMRVCAPPIVATCHFGVDMGRREELIAASRSVEEIRRHIGADSLGYLSLKGLLKAVDVTDRTFCRGCFTGRYPIPVQLEMDKMQLETAEPAPVV
ncbi:MAG: amidophosphoribosyltransferase [Gemmatimonadetes bacterium]|nr:amidophosphoribosyltransferase [Gemmatimonadota bacterium]